MEIATYVNDIQNVCSERIELLKYQKKNDPRKFPFQNSQNFQKSFYVDLNMIETNTQLNVINYTSN